MCLHVQAPWKTWCKSVRKFCINPYMNFHFQENNLKINSVNNKFTELSYFCYRLYLKCPTSQMELELLHHSHHLNYFSGFWIEHTLGVKQMVGKQTDGMTKLPVTGLTTLKVMQTLHMCVSKTAGMHTAEYLIYSEAVTPGTFYLSGVLMSYELKLEKSTFAGGRGGGELQGRQHSAPFSWAPILEIRTTWLYASLSLLLGSHLF